MAVPEIKLSEEDRNTLLALETDIAALEREIAKAERAGIDVTDLREKFDRAKSLREGILREYG